MVVYQPLTFEYEGYEPLGGSRGRQRSIWLTSVGRFEVEQEFAEHPAAGRTHIVGPADLRAEVAWRFGRQGSYLRPGVELELDGRVGVLVRPAFGVRASRRQVLLRLDSSSTCWSVRARMRGFTLMRDGRPVARRVGVYTEVASHVTPQDAAVAILLTVNDVWPGAALWARITAAVVDAV